MNKLRKISSNKTNKMATKNKSRAGKAVKARVNNLKDRVNNLLAQMEQEMKAQREMLTTADKMAQEVATIKLDRVEQARGKVEQAIAVLEKNPWETVLPKEVAVSILKDVLALLPSPASPNP